MKKRKKKRVVHRIRYFVVPYEDPVLQGWKTLCGWFFWSGLHGTTENENVTCTRCLTSLVKAARHQQDKQKKREKGTRKPKGEKGRSNETAKTHL